MNKGRGKFIIGAMIGAALGAVAGLLFAPKSGKETRKIISEKSKNIVVKEEKVAKKAIEAVTEKISK